MCCQVRKSGVGFANLVKAGTHTLCKEGARIRNVDFQDYSHAHPEGCRSWRTLATSCSVYHILSKV